MGLYASRRLPRSISWSRRPSPSGERPALQDPLASPAALDQLGSRLGGSADQPAEIVARTALRTGEAPRKAGDRRESSPERTQRSLAPRQGTDCFRSTMRHLEISTRGRAARLVTGPEFTCFAAPPHMQLCAAVRAGPPLDSSSASATSNERWRTDCGSCRAGSPWPRGVPSRASAHRS